MSTSDQGPPQSGKSLTSSVSGGVLWMLLNTGAAKAVSFIAQAALGLLLSPRDFGVFAMSVAVAGLAGVLRDAGVRQVLVQRGHEYEDVAGPLFWMGLALNLAAGTLLAALSPAMASLYGEPELALLLFITAFSIPLSTPGAMLSARLSIQLRFRALSLVQIATVIIRYGGAVGFALFGFGALSFVLPLPLIAIVEWVATYCLTRSAPWRLAPRFRTWKGYYSALKWTLLTVVGVILCNTGAYVLIGLLVPAELVGTYFFSYQLVIQVGAMLSGNLGQVLFPALSHIRSEPKRQADAVARAARLTMLVAAPMNLSLAACFVALEELVWGGLWRHAVTPVIFLSVAYPAHILLTVPMAFRQANGEFREWAVGLFIYGGGLAAAAAAGAAICGTVAGIAALTAVYVLVAAPVLAAYHLRPAIPMMELGRAVSPAWLISIVAAGAALFIDALVFGSLSAAARVLVTGAIFGAVFTVFARLTLRSELKALVSVLPPALRPRFAWLAR